MNEQERNDVERALNFCTGTNKQTRFFLRRALGKETEYMEINDHIFLLKPSKHIYQTTTWCQNPSCEMSHPLRAEQHDCPTSMEGLLCDDPKRRKKNEQEWEEEHDWNTD